MKGQVILAREAILPIVFVDANGETWEVDCLIDTGSTGQITLPPDAINDLGLSYLRQDEAIVADSRVVETEVFAARILWNGSGHDVEVVSLDREPLIGMELLAGHHLGMDIIDGGAVTVEPL